jgi:general secretion pathway protein C
MAIEAKWSDFSRLDRERALATANRLLPGWVALLLVVAIGWQLARIIWMLAPGSALGNPVDPPPQALQAASRQGPDGPDVQSIASAHIFGVATAGDAPPPPVEAHEDVEETRLNLSLKGTIAMNDSEQSIAIIADTAKDEKIYTLRDTVAPGTTLHAVYADRVILNRSGVLEALKLPQEFPRSAAPVRRPTPTPTRAADTEPSIRDVVSENVTQLADVIRPTPYFVGGQQQGYRVYPGRDRKKFAELGLRPGDLIKDIDGAALTDPQQAMEIFQNLGSADQVSVTVERNGQPQVIVLTTSQLSGDNEEQ